VDLALHLLGGHRSTLTKGLRRRWWLAAAHFRRALEAAHGAHGSRNIVLGEGERASIIAAEAGRAAGDQHGRHLEATHAAWAGKTTDEVLLLCAADALGWFTSDTAVLGNTTEALTATLAQNLHVVHIARAVAANASVAHAWRHGSGR